jgi:hypothetical protein
VFPSGKFLERKHLRLPLGSRNLTLKRLHRPAGGAGALGLWSAGLTFLAPPEDGMSCYSWAEEIMPGRPDYLVELRGFEPVISAMRHPRALDGVPLPTAMAFLRSCANTGAGTIDRTP